MIEINGTNYVTGKPQINICFLAMEKPRSRKTSSVDQTASQPSSIESHPLNTDLNTTSTVLTSRLQTMHIHMDHQYLDFLNENTSIDQTRKNLYLNANMSLKDALSPGESVQEIEISVVAGPETKIHALLLYLAIINDGEELDFQKVSVTIYIIMIFNINLILYFRLKNLFFS